ncbi:MAG: response regulator [Chloroflexi bacterium]|nr:response regulator [Chloroflexota bacterium]
MQSIDIKDWDILIVDDAKDNLEVAKVILEFQGAEIHTATNGEEGMEVLQNLEPRLILLDISMPKMSGDQMLAKIREEPRTKDIPVIAITAHAMKGDRERLLALGFDGYIAKPFRIDTFLDQIKAALNNIERKET